MAEARNGNGTGAAGMSAQRNAEMLEQVYGASLEEIASFFAGEERSEMAMKAVDIAMRALASYARIKATETARSALNWSMARELAENPDQKRQYAAITNPESPLVKMLPMPKPAQ